MATPPVIAVPVLADQVTLADVTVLGTEVGEWTGFTTEVDGVCSSNIAHVEVDSFDLVWAIGTCGGVSRWDGESWVTIFEAPETAGQGAPKFPSGYSVFSFQDIDASPAGPVWVASLRDVFGFDGRDWTATEDPWTDPTIVDLAVDAKGSPWAVVDNRPFPRPGREVGGLWRFDGENWTAIADSPQGGQAVAIEPNGAIWVAGSYTLAQFDEAGWTHYGWPARAGHFEVGYDSEAVLVDGFGTVWVIESVGEGRSETDILWAFDGDSWRRHEFGRLGGLARDDQGQLWTGGDDGVFMFDGSTWTLFSHTLELQPESGLAGIRDVAVDSDGAIWFAATNPNGVLRFRPPNP
jgi:hypothetical protein